MTIVRQFDFRKVVEVNRMVSSCIAILIHVRIVKFRNYIFELIPGKIFYTTCSDEIEAINQKINEFPQIKIVDLFFISPFNRYSTAGVAKVDICLNSKGTEIFIF